MADGQTNIVNFAYMAHFAQVILPLPFDRTFTYRIPDGMEGELAVGCRVLVPFGAKKYYTAIVESVTPTAPTEAFNIKEIVCAIDSRPIVRHPQLKFWKWISDYYLSSIGDVFKAALPAGLKVESETIVELNPDLEADEIQAIEGDETAVLELLVRRKKISAKDIASQTGIAHAETVINRLIERGVAVISEKIVERFRRKRVKYVNLSSSVNITDAFAAVKGAKKQETALLALIALSEHGRKEVTLDTLIERSGVTRAIITALERKGLIEIVAREISRFSPIDQTTAVLPVLSDAQTKALSEIHEGFRDHQTALLHGVTASGKTEIYIHLIDHILQRGDQVLFLVPEIALTTQLTDRLQRVFGERVIIYHSKFSDGERVEIWRRLLNSNEPCVVIGARSAVFLPFARLGLVIVDEEHESSYKQYDPAPRYNGRDAAIMLASMHGAKALLGSATPSVETYYKAISGKYALISLTTRYDDVALPEIEIVDMSRERSKGRVIGSFSQTTIEDTNRALANGKQTIFFHNRRGYAPMARCKACAFVPKCDHCDVSLTYHRRPESLVCHYCGATYPVMRTCPSCSEPAIEIIGYGTERIEDEVESLFPNHRIMRMDLDTTRNKDSYSKIINDFSSHKADILVGTQMVTKGLDFGDVDVVGVINADTLIHYPDFRATERAFNMLEQVSGRAGRRDSTGRVLIQTRQPEHPVLKHVSNHDYISFYGEELEERRRYNYPPFTRVINIYIKHRDPDKLNTFATDYAERLTALLGNRVNGPREPQVSRVQSLYIKSIMLKIETEASIVKVKQVLRDLYIEMQASPTSRGFTIYYDVDPA